MPALVRRMQIDPGSGYPKWRLGYLNGVIQNRDFWMHRVDLARATGHEMVITADHDGRLVAGVVAEWARGHGQPFDLALEGPAGGRFAQAGGGQGDTTGLRLD